MPKLLLKQRNAAWSKPPVQGDAPVLRRCHVPGIVRTRAEEARADGQRISMLAQNGPTATRPLRFRTDVLVAAQSQSIDDGIRAGPERLLSAKAVIQLASRERRLRPSYRLLMSTIYRRLPTR